MKNNITRRNFVKKSSIGLTAMAVSASSYARILGSNERLNIGVAGLNGRGQGHLIAAALGKNSTVTAFCDVDTRTFEKSHKTLEKCGVGEVMTYIDIRKLLENKDIDAVSIAAPDHWHAPMAIMSMNAGKHVYLEKPCSHNPQEGEWLITSSKKTGKVLQIGNQQRSAPTSIQAIQDIQDGIIGEVYYGKAWYANTRGTIGVGKTAPVPTELDWDLWQGPAPRKTYKDNWVHYNWHWFWNWGTGEINNNGLHEMDICRWALGVDYPTKVTSAGGRYHFQDDWQFYDTQVANFEFNGGKMITWEGRSCNGSPFHNRGRGATIHGTNGTILLDRNTYIVKDKGGKLVKQVDEKTYSETTNTVGLGALDAYHMDNFVDSVRTGVAVNSPVLEAHKSTLMCHLGNISQKLNRTLKIDSTTGKILKDKKAMKMWKREYEKGWEPKV
ncbi:MAG: Gfo/Idh/MocA family oxidoreductase [Saprospiraceae bacterium]|nr:Gfo/Idh/MocA family oxidoreductase [Saprospiraceae bacterium]